MLYLAFISETIKLNKIKLNSILTIIRLFISRFEKKIQKTEISKKIHTIDLWRPKSVVNIEVVETF